MEAEIIDKDMGNIPRNIIKAIFTGDFLWYECIYIKIYLWRGYLYPKKKQSI
jgi:hypothetical protein